MKNSSLVNDYIQRCSLRLEVLQLLFDKGGYADVVRESQELVELASKALIRFLGADPARSHDVSTQLQELRDRVKKANDIDSVIQISKKLRRDRELAFYGTEDLTPSEFYQKSDAEDAFEGAKKVFNIVSSIAGTK